jgi:hypothetical protein
VQELTTAAEPHLPLGIDPKLAWALRHPEKFPVDLHTAPRETLLRVPGLGVRNVDRLLSVRRWHRVTLADLTRLRVPLKKVLPFIIAADHRPALVGGAAWRAAFHAAAGHVSSDLRRLAACGSRGAIGRNASRRDSLAGARRRPAAARSRRRAGAGAARALQRARAEKVHGDRHARVVSRRSGTLGAALPRVVAADPRRARAARPRGRSRCPRARPHGQGDPARRAQDARLRPVPRGGARRWAVVRRVVRAGAPHRRAQRAVFRGPLRADALVDPHAGSVRALGRHGTGLHRGRAEIGGVLRGCDRAALAEILSPRRVSPSASRFPAARRAAPGSPFRRTPARADGPRPRG